jgi:FkbM family methyltransferase
MNYVIDIGSNVGDITRELIQDKNNFVISVEPIPYLANNLKNLESNHSNLKVINCAISDEDGEQTFYINEPHCTSSLKKFNDEVKNKWPNRLDYKEKIIVKTIKLSTLIEELSLQNEIISFLKIDTQGSDLDVIKSSEKYLSNIKEIKCETFITDKNNDLYIDESKSDEVIEFMNQNNFILTKNEINETRLWSDLTFKNKKFM